MDRYRGRKFEFSRDIRDGECLRPKGEARLSDILAVYTNASKFELGTIELKRLAGNLIGRTLDLKATFNKRFSITKVKRKRCLRIR